ncbi:replication factor C subunit 3-like [Hibiscus syriacus]|uniref:replication factor C subunit 3-like n=1 Tax=Hibiscus syriacus TaxID=106335 RepID=UPI0019213D76|nr:replication factor C subunit 3-like [Hibiscus syriacus]
MANKSKHINKNRQGSTTNAIPSPTTRPRRSSSDPDLTIKTSKAETLVVIPRLSRSSASTHRREKSSYWISWSNISKLGDFIDRRRKESDLTEESLGAHNEFHGILPHKVHVTNFIAGMNDERNNKCSPYYKGLTDSTLSINREKKSGPDNSPDRESQATTAANSSSSFSSMLGKVQEFGSSCFTCRTTGDHYKDPSTPADVLKPVKATSFSSSTCNKTTTRLEKKEVDDPLDVQLVVEEKPLRERVWEPATTPKDADVYKVHQKYILADKYQPKTLKDFICNRSEVTRLQVLVKSGECNHIIFEGPPGVGKRTMILAMLREVFGPDQVQTRDELKAFHLKGESVGRIEVNVKESDKHIEVNLSDLRGYEKHVIVELMKETQAKNSKSNKALSNDPENCRTIILCEADKLSPDALLYIRWLLERYKAGNKVFFCCSNVSKLQPIRSLCTVIKLLPPSKEEIVRVLEFIAKQEGLSLSHKFAERIAESSKNNLRQAIRSFEACRESSYPFKEDQKILSGWEEDIANIAKNMVEERSTKQLYIIRRKLQNLVEHDVSPDFIFMSLVEEVKKQLQDSLHHQVDCLFEEYNRDDENMIESEDDMETKDSRVFSRIEEFIARFMSWFNKQSKMATAALAHVQGT